MAGKLRVVVLSAVLSLATIPSYAENSAVEKKRIDQAWDDVYKNIGWLTQYFRDLTANGDATERFEAYRTLMALLTDNYLQSVAYDTERPQYLPYTNPYISNYGGPSTAFKYGMVHLEPGASYRVWGKRGNADAIDIQQYYGWYGQDPIPASRAQGSFESHDIKVDEQGNFEFILSPAKPEKGQWWPAEKDTKVLMIRDVFLDNTKEAIPAHFYFEKLGPKKKGPTPPSPEESAARLHAWAKSLKEWDIVFKFPEIAKENEFVAKGWVKKPSAEDAKLLLNIEAGKSKPVPEKTQGGQVTQLYNMALYRLEPGQALIGEWTPPKKFLYWNVLLNNRLLQSLNFFERQTDINDVAAHLDADGVFRFVVSRNDPGVANWLDIDGHAAGAILMRCKLCSERGALPTLKLVPESDVLKHLPAETKLVTPEERNQILALRRQHYLARFHM